MTKEERLREACRLVENVARSLGKDCQIIFTDECVSVAPVSWAGDSTGKTLYDALCDACKEPLKQNQKPSNKPCNTL